VKAFVYNHYGTTEQLRLIDVDIPTPRDNEVLVRVCATSINASDWEILTGRPLYARIYGLFKPKVKTLGSDIAGCVESLGKKVENFHVGDEVFGDVFGSFGGFAEYVSVPAKCLIRKPKNISCEVAASLPQASAIAQQGICAIGHIEAGQHVLINGAGGGAGSFAIQIAKAHGAIVTAVDSGEKLELMKHLGADEVIDYKVDDFTENGKTYDLILDLAAYHPILSYKRSLTDRGRYLMVGGSMKNMMKLVFLGPWLSKKNGKKLGLLTLKTNQGLEDVLKLIDIGKLVAAIDKRFPLLETPQALQYLGDGHAKGKVIITM